MAAIGGARSTVLASPELDVRNAAGRRHPWRWLAGIVVLVLAAQMVGVLVTNENFGWAVVANWLRADSIIRGLGMTLMLTVIAMTIGIALGVLLAVARLSVNPVLRVTAGLYVWFFRGTPTLVQLIFFYNLSALFPHLS